MFNIYLAGVMAARGSPKPLVGVRVSGGMPKTRDPVHVINGGRAVTIESARFVVQRPSEPHRVTGNALGEV